MSQDKAYQGLTQDLTKSYKQASNSDPTQGLIYRTGKANLQQNLRDRTRQDDSRLAARGGMGTELDLAFAADRSGYAANSERNLLGVSAQDQRVRQESEFRNLMSVLRSLDANEQFVRQLEEQRRSELMRAITGGAFNLAGAVTGMPGVGKLAGKAVGSSAAKFIGLPVPESPTA